MELSNAFKALSDESRFKLVNLLLTHDFCVGALAHHLKISEAAVSQHLRQLREAGLVKGEKRGYWTHYTVDKVKLRESYRGILPEVVLNRPSIPPSGAFYNKFGKAEDLQVKAVEAWLEARQ